MDLLEYIPGELEKTIRFGRPGKEEISITVFDVLELHVRHLAERIESINVIRQAHGK